MDCWPAWSRRMPICDWSLSNTLSTSRLQILLKSDPIHRLLIYWTHTKSVKSLAAAHLWSVSSIWAISNIKIKNIGVLYWCKTEVACLRRWHFQTATTVSATIQGSYPKKRASVITQLSCSLYMFTSWKSAFDGELSYLVSIATPRPARETLFWLSCQ